MEKHLSAVGYWLGLLCTALAVICRVLLAFNTNALRVGLPGGLAISYTSFFHGAALFFLLAIASWSRTAKS